MTRTTTIVMATVNAPYGAGLSPEDLAARLVDPASGTSCEASVLAFLTEVAPRLQTDFIREMEVDRKAVGRVARVFAALSGHAIALAAEDLDRVDEETECPAEGKN